MSIESWEPTRAAVDSDVDLATLHHFADLAAVDDFGDDEALDRRLDSAAQASCRLLIHQPPQFWSAAMQKLSADTLRNLIRFFTVAEDTIQGCEVGATSPVVTLNRELKQRGEPLSRDALLWIRNHSGNRFLPNGPL